jgi:Lon protease-like protein
MCWKAELNNPKELPLFPLNTVLFPGMPLHLHIFEPRYKVMIGECIRDSRPFGVVLIRSGYEVGATAETYDTGTTAVITHVKYLEDGEMNIATVGHTRFKISAMHHHKPYLTGLVDDFPLEKTDDPCIGSIARRIAPMVKKYVSIFAELGNSKFQVDKLPEDPVALAFLTAVVLNVPAKDKQHLLTSPDLVSLLRAEQKMLAREALILKHLIENGPRWRDDPGMFSPN